MANLDPQRPVPPLVERTRRLHSQLNRGGSFAYLGGGGLRFRTTERFPPGCQVSPALGQAKVGLAILQAGNAPGGVEAINRNPYLVPAPLTDEYFR